MTKHTEIISVEEFGSMLDAWAAERRAEEAREITMAVRTTLAFVGVFTVFFGVLALIINFPY